MAWKWFEAPVIKIEQHTPNVKRFWVDVQDEDIKFEPGQFVTMDLPISENKSKRWRSYSIASLVSELPILEFIIVKLKDGAGSTYLFEEIKIGDSIRFKGPSGAFVGPKNPDFDLVMICTGTGVAPFRPMIYDLLETQKTKRKIHLIFGSRNEEDILYREEWTTLSEKYNNFTFTPCLSRQDNWDGVKGYVHQVYNEKYKVVRDDIRFYICGWSQMIDEAVVNLIIKLKYPKELIKYELYG